MPPNFDDDGFKLISLWKELFACMKAKKYQKVRELLPYLEVYNSEGIYYKNNSYMSSPFERAIELQDEKLIDLLIERAGPDFQQKTTMGKNILHYACEKNCVTSLDILIKKHNFHTEIIDNDERTALHYCAKFGSADVCQYLLIHADHINDKDASHNAPIHDAFKYKQYAILRMIGESPKCELNIVDGKHRTVTLLACQQNNLEILKWLVNQGADIRTCDVYGVSPLVVSAQNPEVRAIIMGNDGQ